MTNQERNLLQRLAAEGKAAPLAAEEIGLARHLENEGLLFVTEGSTTRAVITPKGRRAIAGSLSEISPPKKPLGFLR